MPHEQHGVPLALHEPTTLTRSRAARVRGLRTLVFLTNLWSLISYYHYNKDPSSLGGSGSNPQGDCSALISSVHGPVSQLGEMAAEVMAEPLREEWRIGKSQALWL